MMAPRKKLETNIPGEEKLLGYVDLPPAVTPPERPAAKTHENPKATRCEVCGTVGSAPVCEVDGWPR